MNLTLIIRTLTFSEQLSLGLGLLSVALGTIAIIQALLYKREQERQARVQDAFLKEQRINMAYSCIRNRMIYRTVHGKENIILRKDHAVIFATSSFHSRNIDQHLDDIKELLSTVLKNCYSNNIIASIKKHDIHLGDTVAVVTLRRECDLLDMSQVLEVNEKLDKYGLYLSLLIE